MTVSPASGPVTLKVNMCSYLPPRALLDGTVRSELVSLDFAGLTNAHAGFKGMLRENRFEMSEMAVATFLIGDGTE